MTSPPASGLSAKEQSAAETLAADLQRVFGARLESLIAYGVAGAAHDDEPLHTLALVERLTFDDLAALAPQADRWHRIGMAVPLLLQLWMFATPILYPLSAVPAQLRDIYALNPLVSIIESFRQALLSETAPDLWSLAKSALISMMLLIASYSYFKRVEATMADKI